MDTECSTALHELAACVNRVKKAHSTTIFGGDRAKRVNDNTSLSCCLPAFSSSTKAAAAAQVHSLHFPSHRIVAVSIDAQVRDIGFTVKRVLRAGHAASVLRAAIAGTIVVAVRTVLMICTSVCCPDIKDSPAMPPG